MQRTHHATRFAVPRPRASGSGLTFITAGRQIKSAISSYGRGFVVSVVTTRMTRQITPLKIATYRKLSNRVVICLSAAGKRASGANTQKFDKRLAAYPPTIVATAAAGVARG